MSDWFVGSGYGSKPTSSKGSDTIFILVSGVIVKKNHRSLIGGDNDCDKAEGKVAQHTTR